MLSGLRLTRLAVLSASEKQTGMQNQAPEQNTHQPHSHLPTASMYPARQEQEQKPAALMVPEDEELPWETPARRAEPTGSSRRAGTHPWHHGSGRTAAAMSWHHRARRAGSERRVLQLGTRTDCGTATAPRHSRRHRGAGAEELACPNDPLNFNTSIIQLFGKEVHGLHGVFASVWVDVRPPGWYFNCRKAGKAERTHEKGSAKLPPTCPGKHPCRLSISRSAGRANLPSFYKQSKRLSFKVARKFLVGLNEPDRSAPLPQPLG